MFAFSWRVRQQERLTSAGLLRNHLDRRTAMEDWLPGSDLLYSFEDGLPDLGDASEWPDWLATADLLPASPNSVSNQLFAPPELPVASTSTVSSCQEGLPGSTQASGSAGIPLETVPDVPVTHASHQDERAGGSSQRDKDNNSKEGNSQQKKAGKKRGAAVMDGSDPTASGQHLPACDGCRIRRMSFPLFKSLWLRR